MHPTWRLLALAAALLTGLSSQGAAAQETRSVSAFATWNLQAVAVPSAPDEVTITGSLHGPVFVEAGQGPMLAGIVTCPGTLTVSLLDGSQQGQGVCAFTAKDGAQAYGRWTCDGYHLVGCKGDFTFTGGRDRLEGIEGGGELLIRGELMTIARQPGAAVTEDVFGIMVWRNLVATLPDKE